MIEFKSVLKPRVAVLLNDRVEVTFTTTKSVIRELEALQGDKELIVRVGEFKERRKLTQNAYLWRLINELSKKWQVTKNELYKMLIRDYGVWDIIPIKNEFVDTFVKMWENNGEGWFCETLGESKLNGYTKIKIYFGSSSYNSKQMQHLLTNLTEICNNVGIKQLSTSELALLQNEND